MAIGPFRLARGRSGGEETSHAAKIIDYMLERGGSPAIPATKAPKTKYASPLEAMKNAMRHEHGNTAGIYACLKVAAEADDPATTEMLQWFVREQVEGEQWADEYARKVEKIEKRNVDLDPLALLRRQRGPVREGDQRLVDVQVQRAFFQRQSSRVAINLKSPPGLITMPTSGFNSG